jgi:2-dehydropantoate 2-reductase
MDVLIWGAGAIGGTIGAYFTRAGHDVVFVDVAEEHVEALNQRGLQIEGPIEEFSVPATAFTPKTITGTHRWVLLCTKAHHTRGAAEALAPHLSDDGCVVSVQNGPNEDVISDVVGPSRTMGAFVNFGADYFGPGRIHFGGRGAVVLGELDGTETDRLERLHELFLAFDDATITTTNIYGYLWGKLAYGAMLFATALTNMSIADAFTATRFRSLFTEIGREVLRVADAKGIEPEGFNGFDPSAYMPGASDSLAESSLDAMVAFNRRSAKTHSGIWRDLAVRKRATEVDAQLGPIVTQGERLGVATPATREIIRMIHEIERGEREQSEQNLEALRRVVLNGE